MTTLPGSGDRGTAKEKSKDQYKIVLYSLSLFQLTISQSEESQHKDGGNCKDFHCDIGLLDCSTKTSVELMLRSSNCYAYIASYSYSYSYFYALQAFPAGTGKFRLNLRLSVAG